jgi:hypothetical protein
MFFRSMCASALLLSAITCAFAQSYDLPEFDADGVPQLNPDGTSNASNAPWEDYDKFIHKRSGVSAVGPEGFGDSVSLYNGALSFSVTDISVPGNSALPVALTRTMSVSPRPDFYMYDDPLADWDLDVPRISGVYGPTWPATRCSSVTAGTAAPNVTVVGGATYTGLDYYQGLQASMPGGGELIVADRTTPKPSTGTYKWLTPALTYISCLPSIQNGSGEGFSALTADGTRYTFDYMAQTYEPPLQNPSSLGTLPGELNRRNNIMYATRVEDRFGHWVTYSYSNSATLPAQLTKIEADDGRLIELTYYGSGKLKTAVSHGRTWTYAYNGAGSSLTSVTLAQAAV